MTSIPRKNTAHFEHYNIGANKNRIARTGKEINLCEFNAKLTAWLEKHQVNLAGPCEPAFYDLKREIATLELED